MKPSKHIWVGYLLDQGEGPRIPDRTHGLDLSRFRRVKDKRAHLFGRLLLARKLGEPTIASRIAYDVYHRPYLPDRPDLDFNISHTGGLVACAVAKQRIGLDVERLAPISRLDEFRRVFTDREYAYLERQQDLEAAFYRLWTRKEAVMKADGRGFHLDAAAIDCLGEAIWIGPTEYAVRSLDLSPNHAVHLAGLSLGTIETMQFWPAELLGAEWR